MEKRELKKKLEAERKQKHKEEQKQRRQRMQKKIAQRNEIVVKGKHIFLHCNLMGNSDTLPFLMGTFGLTFLMLHFLN